MSDMPERLRIIPNTRNWGHFDFVCTAEGTYGTLYLRAPDNIAEIEARVKAFAGFHDDRIQALCAYLSAILGTQVAAPPVNAPPQPSGDERETMRHNPASVVALRDEINNLHTELAPLRARCEAAEADLKECEALKDEYRVAIDEDYRRIVKLEAQLADTEAKRCVAVQERDEERAGRKLALADLNMSRIAVCAWKQSYYDIIPSSPGADAGPPSGLRTAPTPTTPVVAGDAFSTPGGTQI